MPKFNVTVEKMYRCNGVIEVEADNAEDAESKVTDMMVAESPLQTNDQRIQWDEPEYEDETFQTTGDVDEV